MKNILIIGSATGTGKALSEQLAKEGNRVFATYNQTIPDYSHENIHHSHLNVLDEEFDLSTLPSTIDGLVFCVGSINLKPFTRIKPEDFLADYNLQVVGVVKVIQAVLPKLKLSNSGSIVLFSTVAVQNGFPFHTQVASSKGAIEGLTTSLAAEFAPQIRVNCIAPSITQTPLAGRLLNSEEKIAANGQRHPLKRIGQPKDLAEMAAFLLSDNSSWITGQILKVDGGMSSIK